VSVTLSECCRARVLGEEGLFRCLKLPVIDVPASLKKANFGGSGLPDRDLTGTAIVGPPLRSVCA
jgi:hypothetical protein